MSDFFKKLFGKEGKPSEDQTVGEMDRYVNVAGAEIKKLNLGELLSTVGEAVSMAASQASGSPSTNQLWLTVRVAMGMPTDPSVKFVKRTQCPTCGAAKSLPPKTAYVYCDYCGNLTDYDFQMACSTPNSMMPGPAYEQLLRSLQLDMQSARQTQDVEKYRQIQRQLFGKWIQLCPLAVSPRAKEPEYREQLVHYMAECQVVNDFDPTYAQMAQEVQVLQGQLQWGGQMPQRVAVSDTFWPLYDKVKEQVTYAFDNLEAKGVTSQHPDGATKELQARLTWSMFAQGWIPWLAPEDSQRLIKDSGLGGEYTQLEPKETTLKHCGGCGSEMHVVPGAKAVVCEQCGNRIDVHADEMTCTNCGGLISFPVGKNRVNCPFCQTEAQRMSW